MNEHQERWAAVQAGTAQPASVADAIRAAVEYHEKQPTMADLAIARMLRAALPQAEAYEALIDLVNLAGLASVTDPRAWTRIDPWTVAARKADDSLVVIRTYPNEMEAARAVREHNDDLA